MDRFIRCLCDDDYTALLKYGTAPLEKLQEAWLLILSEYYEIKGDTVNGNEMWRLSRDIQRLQHHLDVLSKCVKYLRWRWSDIIAEQVNRLGYKFNPEVKEPDAYEPLIEGIVIKSRINIVKIKQLSIQLSKLLKKQKEATAPTRLYFEELMTAIEEIQHCRYDLEQINVAKYIALEKKFWQKIENLKHEKSVK